MKCDYETSKHLNYRESFDYVARSIVGHIRAIELVWIIEMFELQWRDHWIIPFVIERICFLSFLFFFFWFSQRRFVNLIESSFSTPLLVQCGINVACLSVSLYRVSSLTITLIVENQWYASRSWTTIKMINLQMTTLLGMSTETFKYVAFLAAQLFHIFCICYSGQRIIDHSSETFSKAYVCIYICIYIRNIYIFFFIYIRIFLL